MGAGAGAAGLWRQPVESRSGGSLCPGERSPPAAGALDPGLGLSAPRESPARENPGPLPGAAALPGRAGGGDSRNLPGDRAGVTEQNRPIYGQRFRRVSGESPGAGRLGGARVHIPRFVLGGFFPATACPASDASAQGMGGLDAWTGPWDTREERAPKATAGGSPFSLHPPGLEERRPQELIKTIFFYLNRFNKKSNTHTNTS